MIVARKLGGMKGPQACSLFDNQPSLCNQSPDHIPKYAILPHLKPNNNDQIHYILIFTPSTPYRLTTHFFCF
jgi:hypothetical protein